MYTQFFLIFFLFFFSACQESSSLSHTPQEENLSQDKNKSNTPKYIDYKTKIFANSYAYIPPMCYTKTKDEQGNIHNPCYACHSQSLAPNYNNDQDLQAVYSFPLFAKENHWSNLFVNRQEDVKKISDVQIENYINTSNYLSKDQSIILENKLRSLPKDWDIFNDNFWHGYIPDAYFNFDTEGFDIDPHSQKYTGWRAFAYTPFLGTFWATNGSTDDVLIRLDEIFMQDKNALYNHEIYKINLAIVEALILRKDVYIAEIDENDLGYDLDHNGILSITNKVSFWEGNHSNTMQYVGLAEEKRKEGFVHLSLGLFPEKTEFLHSVRYVKIDENNQTQLSERMKELRYAIKRYWVQPSLIQDLAEVEAKDKMAYPNKHRQFSGNFQTGLDNKQGWRYQAFIEDSLGDLRPQTQEELLYCMGCHNGLGATSDGTFSFARKISQKNTFQEGWYHPSQKGLKNSQEPLRKDGEFEYSFYLKHNKAGDEFRENTEVLSRFFLSDNKVNEEQITALHKDISLLIFPSKQRALLLSKAYYLIVQEQTFTKGRDSTIFPVENVHKSVEDNQSTGIELILDAQGE